MPNFAVLRQNLWWKGLGNRLCGDYKYD